MVRTGIVAMRRGSKSGEARALAEYAALDSGVANDDDVSYSV